MFEIMKNTMFAPFGTVLHFYESRVNVQGRWNALLCGVCYLILIQYRIKFDVLPNVLSVFLIHRLGIKPEIRTHTSIGCRIRKEGT